MKLSDWLTINSISVADFAEKIGLSRQAVHRYLAGDRIPKRDIMKDIAAATGGEVAPVDWFREEETAA